MSTKLESTDEQRYSNATLFTNSIESNGSKGSSVRIFEKSIDGQIHNKRKALVNRIRVRGNPLSGKMCIEKLALCYICP